MSNGAENNSEFYDYYKLFGIEPFTPVDVKTMSQKKKELLRRWHPDPYTGIEHQWKLRNKLSGVINGAYSVLTNPEEKNRYDTEYRRRQTRLDIFNVLQRAGLETLTPQEVRARAEEKARLDAERKRKAAQAEAERRVADEKNREEEAGRARRVRDEDRRKREAQQNERNFHISRNLFFAEFGPTIEGIKNAARGLRESDSSSFENFCAGQFALMNLQSRDQRIIDELSKILSDSLKENKRIKTFNIIWSATRKIAIALVFNPPSQLESLKAHSSGRSKADADAILANLEPNHVTIAILFRQFNSAEIDGMISLLVTYGYSSHERLNYLNFAGDLLRINHAKETDLLFYISRLFSMYNKYKPTFLQGIVVTMLLNTVGGLIDKPNLTKVETDVLSNIYDFFVSIPENFLVSPTGKRHFEALKKRFAKGSKNEWTIGSLLSKLSSEKNNRKY